jgi:AmmeMemoRadiSam system protein A
MLRSSETPSSLTSAETAEYTSKERQELLHLAHDAIILALEHREAPPFTPSPHLSELRGAFTTLYSKGKLRGCVGYPLPLFPLARTVIETATAAALSDPRFVPVALDEARQLRVSISVLSQLRPIRAEEVEIGRHGLLVSQNANHGLLLPQVAVEHGWDRITFLEQTCAKAGLPANAWHTGAGLEAFTAEVFADGVCEG